MLRPLLVAVEEDDVAVIDRAPVAAATASIVAHTGACVITTAEAEALSVVAETSTVAEISGAGVDLSTVVAVTLTVVAGT